MSAREWKLRPRLPNGRRGLSAPLGVHPPHPSPSDGSICTGFRHQTVPSGLIRTGRRLGRPTLGPAGAPARPTLGLGRLFGRPGGEARGRSLTAVSLDPLGSDFSPHCGLGGDPQAGLPAVVAPKWSPAPRRAHPASRSGHQRHICGVDWLRGVNLPQAGLFTTLYPRSFPNTFASRRALTSGVAAVMSGCSTL